MAEGPRYEEVIRLKIEADASDVGRPILQAQQQTNQRLREQRSTGGAGSMGALSPGDLRGLVRSVSSLSSMLGMGRNVFGLPQYQMMAIARTIGVGILRPTSMYSPARMVSMGGISPSTRGRSTPAIPGGLSAKDIADAEGYFKRFKNGLEQVTQNMKASVQVGRVIIPGAPGTPYFNQSRAAHLQVAQQMGYGFGQFTRNRQGFYEARVARTTAGVGRAAATAGAEGAAAEGSAMAMAGRLIAGGAAGGPVGLAVTVAAGMEYLRFKNIFGAEHSMKSGIGKVAGAYASADPAKTAIEGGLQFGSGAITFGASIIPGVGPITGLLAGIITKKVSGLVNGLVNAMDGLVNAFKEYTPMVFAEAKRYEVVQMLFRRQIGAAFQPMLIAWIKVKESILDVLVKFAPLFNALAKGVASALDSFTKYLTNSLPAIQTFAYSLVQSVSDISAILAEFAAAIGANGLSGALLNATNAIANAAEAINPVHHPWNAAPTLSDQQKAWQQAFIGSLGGWLKNQNQSAPDTTWPQPPGLQGLIGAPAGGGQSLSNPAGGLGSGPNFASGGLIGGANKGRDDRFIAVGGGEYVLNARAAQRIGIGRLNRMNFLGGFDAGGSVYDPPEDIPKYYYQGGIPLVRNWIRVTPWGANHPKFERDMRDPTYDYDTHPEIVPRIQYIGPRRNSSPSLADLARLSGPYSEYARELAQYNPPFPASKYTIQPRNYIAVLAKRLLGGKFGSSAAIPGSAMADAGPIQTNSYWDLTKAFGSQLGNFLTGAPVQQIVPPWAGQVSSAAIPGGPTTRPSALASVPGTPVNPYDSRYRTRDQFGNYIGPDMGSTPQTPNDAYLGTLSQGSGTGSGPGNQSGPVIRPPREYSMPRPDMMKFQTNIQQNITQNINEEEQVMKAIWQIRERLLNTFNTYRQETQLFCETLEGSMIANGL